MIWLILCAMLLVGAAIVAWPLTRQAGRVSPSAMIATAFVIAVSGGLYALIGTPQSPSAGSELLSVEEMVAGLAERLQNEPNDPAGWKMLGRSYMHLGNYDEAIAAFERAVKLEAGPNGQTLADLGEALWMHAAPASRRRAGELFENAIARSPNNPKALFYSGLAAMERGERFLAADRWEALLALAPPENIQDILRNGIAELRGEPSSVAQSDSAPVVSASIELGPQAQNAIEGNATVFVIARDPLQPSPPIAAVRRTVAELPAVVALGDSDAMIPGRLLSAFAELEIVARVSMSGQPIAQPGDWYGETTVRPGDSARISIVIDKKVQ